MIDKNALTSTSRRWDDKLLFYGALVFRVVFIASITVFLLIRIYSGYVTQHRVRAAEEQIQLLRSRLDAVDKANDARLNEIERTLFGDVAERLREQQATAPLPTKGKVEQWQINRDRELRDRIRALEEWRLNQGK